MSISRFAIFAGVVLGAVTLTYSNHFGNSFHFDDFHSVTNNVFIRDLRNFPKFFTDVSTVSALPSNRAWRPLVTASLALDYWMGKGYQPWWFQVSTFVWFLCQLVLMYLLFVEILNRVRPGLSSVWVAWYAVALYGLHPAIAETVNYIIQRADVMSTCGAVAGMAVWARLPRLRKYHIYLVPVAVALLAKAPALIFPLLLLAYVFLFEEELSFAGFKAAAWKLLPSLALSVVFAWLQSAMTPKSFTPGALSAHAYLITQPYVAFRYFTSFFLPLHLSADTDLGALSTIFSLEGLGGLAFLAALLFTIYATARQPITRPISFGLTWFVLALIPTSVFPLAEVENDHRMFFPFVGLVLAVTWTVALFLFEQPLLEEYRAPVAAGLAAVLIFCAAGTRRRNEIWRTEESLWQDVSLKSPRNGRGLMNYGLNLMNRGDIRGALTYFERAQAYTPNYVTLEINLGVADGAMNRDGEAEAHFRRAIQLAPVDAGSHYFYGRWLNGRGRTREAIEQLKTSIALNPVDMNPRYLLLAAYADQGQEAALKLLVDDSIKLAPNDPGVLRYQAGSYTKPRAAVVQIRPPTAESLLDQSLGFYQAKNYPACISAAKEALRLRPNYAEAYNNIAAAYQSMGQWDQAIQAAQQALRIKSDFQLAKNNLAWSESQKKIHAGPPK